jgi:ketosteroid isomerase-like protein
MIGEEPRGYREVTESTPNCDVARASFDTYNARDWAGYQALQHSSVQWYEVEGRFFHGVDGVTEEVDNWRDAYPEASADVTNLFDCGDDRVVIEWTLSGERRGIASGPGGQEIPQNIRVYSADLMQLRGGSVYAGRTYYGLESAQTVLAVQGGVGESSAELPDPPQYRTRLDDTPNARVAMASFDTYNARDWEGYRALQHAEVVAHEVEGRLFRGVDGVIAEVDVFAAAYPDAEAVVMNLVDCGGDRVIIEWTLFGSPGRVHACDLMQLRDGKVFRVRTYYGLASALAVIGVQGLDG